MSQAVARSSSPAAPFRRRPPHARPASAAGSLRRTLYAATGVVCVGIGAVGVFVPGLPTTIWLMAASYLFLRSHPRLEAKLVRNRFFGPYLVYLDHPARMPRRAKVVATAMMWTSVSASLGLLLMSGALHLWLATTIAFAAAAGTWFIWRVGR